MKGKRVLLFFVFAFLSVGLPVVLPWIYIGIYQVPKSTVEAFFDNHLAAILWFFAIYYPILIFPWSYTATWASTVDPQAGTKPLLKQDLIQILLSVNDPKLPWQIKRGDKEDLIAEWKIVDEKWVDLFAANKISLVHKLRFRIDDRTHTVHAQDVERRVSYRVGVDGRPQATLHWSGHRGIDFYDYERGLTFGVIFKDGKLQIGEAYNYKFNLNEMKQPLIDAVTKGGWRWKGALSVSPFWSVIFGG